MEQEVETDWVIIMVDISVVVPVYNTEKYLHKCIESILNQTFRNIEVILIDDGSVDGSGSICDEYKIKDERVKVFHQPNSGVSVARNKGIIESTGNYICFVDSDDYIDGDYFEKAMEYIYGYNHDILINNLYEDKSKLKEDLKLNIMLMDKQEAIRRMFEKKYFEWCPVASFYKANICKTVLFDKSICYGEDLLFKYLFLRQSDKILYVSLRKYCYVFRDDSACNSYNLLKKADDLKVLRIIMVKERMHYRNEYFPRLIKYYRMAKVIDSEYCKKINEDMGAEIKKNICRVLKDGEIKASVKLKLLCVFLPKFVLKLFY